MAKREVDTVVIGGGPRGYVCGIRLGPLVPLPLFRDHVQELRSVEVTDVLQRRDQGIEVVAVDRTVVMEAEFLEQGAGSNHALDVLLGATGQFEQRWGETEHVAAGLAGDVEGFRRGKPGQDIVQRADRWRDRHFIVVEDDQHVGIGDAGVVQRLEGHAGRHRTVADDGHDLAVLALLFGG